MYRLKTKDGWYVSGTQHLTKDKTKCLTYYNRVDAEQAQMYFELQHEKVVEIEVFEWWD